MQNLKKAGLIVLVIFYFVAGVNHFVNPSIYVSIIPGYLPYPEFLNLLSGACEIAFGLLLIPNKTRPFAAWGIVLMLIAFLPVHVKMIADAPFGVGPLRITPFVAWVRIIIFQPLLILWAVCYTTNKVPHPALSKGKGF
jgi:uncharacterized membrane protein